MVEIKCLEDIRSFAKKGAPTELVDKLLLDLKTIKQWDDTENEWTFEEFNTDYTNGGYIAIIEGQETKEEIEGIGLTGGLDCVFPEDATIYHFEGVKFVRCIVIYNDSYAMILWLKNYDGYDSYDANGNNSPQT